MFNLWEHFEIGEIMFGVQFVLGFRSGDMRP